MKRAAYAATVLLAGGILSAVLYPWIAAGMLCWEDPQVRSAMKGIVLGMHNYHDARGTLPTVGTAAEDAGIRSSWRFRLLPWLDSGNLGPEFFSKSWDSSDPDYARFRERPLPVYCFSRRGGVEAKVLAITGGGTAFPKNDRSLSVGELDSDTVLIVTHGSSGVHWMAPGDQPIDRINARTIRTLSLDGCSFYVGFADGTVWRLSTDTPADHLRAFATVEGAKRLDRDVTLGRYRLDGGGER